jgi:hypothetical protein
MRTDDWIDALATGLEPVPAGQPARRLMGALALGTVLAVLVVVLGYGVRPDWADALQQPVMWLKLGFPALLAAAAGVVLWRLSVPGRLPGALAWAWLPLTLAMSGLGLWVLMRAEASQRNMLWMGQTWGSCTLSIAAVSLPVLAALLLAVRTLAPTQLRWAGAMAGVLSGASGTLAYAIYCPEMAVPFLALWNTLAIALMALLGAWLGPRTLRW